MKNWKSFAIAALMIGFGGGSAWAAQFSSPADVHTGPGESYPVIAQIPADATVDFIDCGPGWKNNWCSVKYNGKKGFVVANALAPSASGNDVIVAPVVTTNAAYMRKGPNTTFPVVAVLVPGSEVNVKQCISGWLSGWCNVDFEGTSGWVHGSLLKRQGALFD